MKNGSTSDRSWKGSLYSTVPILKWLPQYQKDYLKPDVIAGLTLAAYAVPVSVAYASLAGLPPQAGLYCYLLGGIAYAFFGTSRQVAVGPTSAISILIGSAIGTLATGDALRHSHLAAAVGVLAGCIGILAWLLHLGNISNFVSETVLSGFKVGAGLVIGSTQLPKLFGIASGGSNFFTRLIGIVKHLPKTNLPTLAVGLGALALLIVGERLLPRRPVALFVVIISIAITSLFALGDKGIKTVNAIPQGFPTFQWPVVQWSEVDSLLGLALACFLLSYVESISVVRTFALKHRYDIDADQELLALGVANFTAGIGQGYALAGGMSQSAVNEKAGAKTPLALVVASCGIGLVLLFLTGLMRNLPEPVLAAVVLMAVGGLVRLREIRHLYRVSRMEFRVAMMATLGVLGFGILKGVLLAAVFSILLLLKAASHPRIATLGRLPGSVRFVNSARHSESEPVASALILRVESGLFYFNAQNVKAEILKRLQQKSGTQYLIIDLSTSANIDLAAVRMLRELDDQVTQLGSTLALAEVHGSLRDLLQLEQLTHVPGVTERMRIDTLIGMEKRRVQIAS